MSEIVSNVAIAVTKPVEIELPADHIKMINGEIKELFEQFTDQAVLKENILKADDKKLDIRALVESGQEKTDKQKLSVLISILSIFEAHCHNLVEETFLSQTRLKEIQEINKEFNVKELQTEYVRELIEKLMLLLN